MNGTASERHRTERGVILEILAEDTAEWTTVRSLWRMMDRRGFSLSMDNLQWHLTKYLAPRKYVDIRRARETSFQDAPHINPDRVMLVKILPDALSLINHTYEDPEVAI